jgi:hypothetical protein
MPAYKSKRKRQKYNKYWLLDYISILQFHPNYKQISIAHPNIKDRIKHFTFDNIFTPETTQQIIY